MNNTAFDASHFAHKVLAPGGVLIGGGGGFTLWHSDFLLSPDGTVSYLTYEQDYEGGGPKRLEQAKLLRKAEQQRYAELLEQLRNSGFYEHTTGPVPSDVTDYLLAVDGDLVHGIRWAKGDVGSLPPKIGKLVTSLRGEILRRFQDEHGA